MMHIDLTDELQYLTQVDLFSHCVNEWFILF